jgi:hypothetical protein
VRRKWKETKENLDEHDQPLPTPLLTKNPLQQLLRLRAVFPVETVVGRHERFGVGMLDGETERFEVDLAKSALRYDRIHRETFELLVVGCRRGIEKLGSSSSRPREGEEEKERQKKKRGKDVLTKCLMHAATPFS